MKEAVVTKSLLSIPIRLMPGILLLLLFTGCGGNVSVKSAIPTVTISAVPASIPAGSSSTLTVTATSANQVTVTGSDGTTYSLQGSGGTQAVSPKATTTYTAAATGPGGNTSSMAIVTVSASPAPTISIVANPASVVSGSSSTLTVVATNATQVTVTGTDGSAYTLPPSGGTQAVTPAATTTYTAAATGAGGNASASAIVTVVPSGSVQSIDHVIFMLQENHTFDNYFGMLNPYRQKNKLDVGDDGVTYSVDGIDDKLATISNQDDEGTSFPLFLLPSTCIDDDSSDWLASYGSVDRYDFTTTRPILMDGFVHTAEGYDKSCALSGICSGKFTTPLTGQLAMGYYDDTFLNYYYYMASQFAVSDRWFSPVASKSIDNRIATFTGGTTQGLVKDPGGDDHLSQLNISNIFEALDKAGVSWKIYYTVSQGFCLNEDDCQANPNVAYPATDFSNLTYSYQYLYDNPTGAPCKAPTVGSSVVQDAGDSFCIDPSHINRIATYFTDLTDGTLPSFAFIEAGYGNNDEHPGSGQSILYGQIQVASVVNAFMASSSWNDSVFFFSYDEGGGPYDHVPPVPGYSNKFTDAMVGDTPVANIPDIGGVGAKDGVPGTGGIAVNPDATPADPNLYFPCVPTPSGTPTLHCDLELTDPGGTPGDAAADYGFAAQLGFRLPNIIISPFTRKHYVSHTPMDHTAVLKFVEDRFIGNHIYLTNRDAAQPNLLEFFDFAGIPWATPPNNIPTPVPVGNTCNPATVWP
jgi:phospholipase C